MPDTYYDSAIDSIYQDQENCLKHFFSGYPFLIRFEIFCFPDTGLQIRVCNLKLFFFQFLNQNICCGYTKEPAHWDGSFEHPKHMFKLIGKKIITILC